MVFIRHPSKPWLPRSRLRLLAYGLVLLLAFFAVTFTAFQTAEADHAALLHIQTDRERALDYIHQFRDLSRSVSFFHIPKTAGTAIEQAAGQRGVSWGSCRFPHKPKRDVCLYPPNFSNWPPYIGWWHLPPSVFPLLGANPYHHQDLFAVVRHPYDRMVSEFYYICSLRVKSWRPDQCERDRLEESDYFNHWIAHKLRDGKGYAQDNGHFTSQFDFVYGPNQVRYVDYVLSMEDLEQQFGRLSDAFGLDMQLQEHNALGAKKRGTLTTQHLNETTLRTIQEVYRQDFDKLGYHM